MPTLPVDPSSPDPDAIARAAAVLKRGGLVAFPTETVYGLGAHALDPAAVARIFAAKGRPDYNPLIVHVAGVEEARGLAAAWSDAAERLAAAFWPGPLTLVVPRSAAVPDAVTAGLPTVALRVPAHPVARALLEAARLPVAAPSANRSTELSPTRAAHVEKSLRDRVELILDGGPTEVGIESTVVSLTAALPTVLRPGTVSTGELRAVLGEVAELSAQGGGRAARPSPGMLDRHYAPRGELRLFGAEERARVQDDVYLATLGGRDVGALVFTPLAAPVARQVTMPADPAAYARGLYAALHALDDAGCDLVLVERVPGEAAWDGVRDRLRRAAHPR